MRKSQKITLANVDKASNALTYALDNISWSNYYTQLVDLCAGEEKQHRGFGDRFKSYHTDAPSVAACARFFAVHRIGQYLAGQKIPDAADYLHFQKSAFYAAGIVASYEKECREALERAGISAEYLADLDYSTFISPVSE